MRCRVHHLIVVSAAMILLAACGSSSSAGDTAPTSESSPTVSATEPPTPLPTATPTASPTMTPSPTSTQPAAAPTSTVDGTPSGGARAPEALADSPAYIAPLFDVAPPDDFDLDLDERIGRAYEGSMLASSRGFVAGRMQVFSALDDLYAAQLECGEFRSVALAKDAVAAGREYSTSALATSQGYVMEEMEIAPLGDTSAAVVGTLDYEGFTIQVAEVWYATDTILCTVLGFAYDGDPLAEIIAIAEAAE